MPREVKVQYKIQASSECLKKEQEFSKLQISIAHTLQEKRICVRDFSRNYKEFSISGDWNKEIGRRKVLTGIQARPVMKRVTYSI